jgi:hypothetical protein
LLRIVGHLPPLLSRGAHLPTQSTKRKSKWPGPTTSTRPSHVDLARPYAERPVRADAAMMALPGFQSL